MNELFLLTLAVVAAGVGLWDHDLRCIAAGAVLIFAAWLIHDVESCVERAEPRDEKTLVSDLLRTVR